MMHCRSAYDIAMTFETISTGKVKIALFNGASPRFQRRCWVEHQIGDKRMPIANWSFTLLAVTCGNCAINRMIPYSRLP